jgi:hypothetical protein
MPAKPKGLDYTFNLKLSIGDREKLNQLQENGMNMSQYFRIKLRELYTQMRETNK